MKLYDKVFIPTEGFTNLTVKELIPVGQRKSILVERKENAIVLSPEELREVWQAAQEFQRQAPNNMTFNEYLTSKGIIL